jgi:hypothetical protein
MELFIMFIIFLVLGKSSLKTGAGNLRRRTLTLLASILLLTDNRLLMSVFAKSKKIVSGPAGLSFKPPDTWPNILCAKQSCPFKAKTNGKSRDMINIFMAASLLYDKVS